MVLSGVFSVIIFLGLVVAIAKSFKSKPLSVEQNLEGMAEIAYSCAYYNKILALRDIEKQTKQLEQTFREKNKLDEYQRYFTAIRENIVAGHRHAGRDYEHLIE